MRAKSTQTWSIIVVGYNEEANILRVLGAVEETMRELDPPAFEIIVVDDGSKDASPRLLREEAESRPNVRVIYHEVNKGIGEALLTGYGAVRYENVLAVPGDGQFDITEIRPFADVPPRTLISFTREAQSSYTVFRRVLSRINAAVNRAFLGLELADVNWVKIFKREQLEALDLKLRSSLVQSEICAKLVATGCQVVEPRSKYLPRQGGGPKGASAKIVMQAARDTYALTRVLRGFKRTRGLV